MKVVTKILKMRENAIKCFLRRQLRGHFLITSTLYYSRHPMIKRSDRIKLRAKTILVRSRWLTTRWSAATAVRRFTRRWGLRAWSNRRNSRPKNQAFTYKRWKGSSSKVSNACPIQACHRHPTTTSPSNRACRSSHSSIYPSGCKRASSRS